MHKPFAEEVKIGGVILFRLMPNEDLFTNLNKIAKDHGIERGVILSAIGSLKDVRFRNLKPNIDLPVRLEETSEMWEAGPFELLSLSGNLFPAESGEEPIVHLHIMLGSPSGGVMGGHLFGATVFTTLEIMIGKLAGSSALRVRSDVTGLMELLTR